MRTLNVKAAVDNLSFYYGQHRALKNLTIPIAERQVTALIGPSGCGKSTFLRCFNRMHDLQPDTRYEGSITLHPDNLNLIGAGVDPIEVRMRIGMVFQKPNPFPKSIFENVAYGLRLRGVRNRATLAEEVEKALRGAALWDEVKDRLQDSALALSGGQMQRLCIARALATDAGDPAVRRADLGARSDRDREDRGADLDAARPGDGADRHAQHATGRARSATTPRSCISASSSSSTRRRRSSRTPRRRRRKTTSPAVTAEAHGGGRSDACPIPMEGHTAKAFDGALTELRLHAVGMGGLVIDQVATAVRALLDADADLAQIVLSRETQVNELERAVDREAFKLIALHQPVAGDLRMAMAVSRMTVDLERAGDESKKIARFAARMATRRAAGAGARSRTLSAVTWRS